MSTESQTPPTVSAAKLKERLDGGEQITIVDTRQGESFEEWRIEHPNATVVNILFMYFLENQDGIPDGVPEGPLVTCCAKGISSMTAAKQLQNAGYEVESVKDGMEGWATLYRGWNGSPC